MLDQSAFLIYQSDISAIPRTPSNIRLLLSIPALALSNLPSADKLHGSPVENEAVVFDSEALLAGG